MGKRWIWILIILGVLLLAFLFPRIMLLVMEKDIESRVLTYGTGTLLNFDAMTIGEKQSLLSDPDVSIIREELSAQESNIIRTLAERELQFLTRCGAIPQSVFDSLWAEFRNEEILSCKAYDPNGKNLFYFYSMETHGAFLRLDHDTEKILALGTYISQEDIGDTSGEAQLRSWAEYFGMSVSHLNLSSQEGSDDHQNRTASCQLTGSANSSCYYSVSLNPHTNYWKCSSILLPETIPDE